MHALISWRWVSIKKIAIATTLYFQLLVILLWEGKKDSYEKCNDHLDKIGNKEDLHKVLVDPVICRFVLT